MVVPSLEIGPRCCMFGASVSESHSVSVDFAVSLWDRSFILVSKLFPADFVEKLARYSGTHLVHFLSGVPTSRAWPFYREAHSISA